MLGDHILNRGYDIESRDPMTERLHFIEVKGRVKGATTVTVTKNEILTSLIGADVEVTMEIQARVPDGIPDSVARTVSENCKTLKFQNQGFEKD